MARFAKFKNAVALSLVIVAAIVFIVTLVADLVVAYPGGYPIWLDLLAFLIFPGIGVVLTTMFGLGLRSGSNAAEWLSAVLALPAALGGFILMALVHMNAVFEFTSPIETWWTLEHGLFNFLLMVGWTILVVADVVAFVLAVAALIIRARQGRSTNLPSAGPTALPAT